MSKPVNAFPAPTLTDIYNWNARAGLHAENIDRSLIRGNGSGRLEHSEARHLPEGIREAYFTNFYEKPAQAKQALAVLKQVRSADYAGALNIVASMFDGSDPSFAAGIRRALDAAPAVEPARGVYGPNDYKRNSYLAKLGVKVRVRLRQLAR